MSLPGGKVSNMLLGKSKGQLLIVPERMKQLGQSGNDAQLWMCLGAKVKSDAVKKRSGEYGVLQSMGLQRVRQNLVNKQQQQEQR